MCWCHFRKFLNNNDTDCMPYASDSMRILRMVFSIISRGWILINIFPRATINHLKGYCNTAISETRVENRRDGGFMFLILIA